MASQNFRVKNGLEVGTGITISPNGNINSSGIVTASSFSGDGSGLTGIGVTRSLTIGSRSTSYIVNIVGTGVTLSLRSGIGTASF